MSLSCLNESDECRGEVAYRMALSGTGRSFPRCDHHWSERLDRQQKIRERYESGPRTCKHGTFIGDPYGADYICGRCENE